MDKMPSIFSGSGILLVLSNMVFYLCLTLLVIIGSVVLGHPGYTRFFAMIFISQSYIVFIWYMTDAHRYHIGIQVWTTDVLHTLGYQVIPTTLNHRQLPDPCELSLDYWVSHNNLLFEDMLFNQNPPAIGKPHVKKDEVLCAPPTYLEQYNHPLMEANCALFLTHRGQLNLNWDERPVRPYGLSNGPSAHCWVPCPQGTVTHPMADCMHMCAYLNRISNAEVNQVLSYALYPEIQIRDTHDEPIGSGPFQGNLDTVNCTETRTNPSTRL